MGDEVGKVPRWDATLVRDVCGNPDVLMKERPDGFWVRLDHHEAAIAALEGQIEKLKADAKIGDEMLEALEAKYEGCPHHPITEASVCGCSYDRIGDVCAFHAPALASAKQRVGELEEALKNMCLIVKVGIDGQALPPKWEPTLKAARAALENKE